MKHGSISQAKQACRYGARSYNCGTNLVREYMNYRSNMAWGNPYTSRPFEIMLRKQIQYYLSNPNKQTNKYGKQRPIAHGGTDIACHTRIQKDTI